MKLKNALDKISPDGAQRERIFNAIEDKLSAKSDGKDKIMKNNKKITVSIISAAAVVCMIGGTAYAVSPDVRDIVQDILGINRQSVGTYYEEFGNDVTDLALIDEGLQITEEDGSAEFAEGIRVKMVGILNTGHNADVILEFTFDEPEYDVVYFSDDLTVVPENNIYQFSYGPSGMDIKSSGKGYMRVNLHNIDDIPTDETLKLHITSIRSDDPENTKVISGEYSTEFTLGKPMGCYNVEFEPVQVSWATKVMFGQVAQMEISRISYSPKEISVGIRMVEDCTVDGDDGVTAASYTNNAAMFCSVDGYMQMWQQASPGDPDYMECTDIPLKFKMSDGSVRCAKYTTASVIESAYFHISENKEDSVFYDFSTDKVNDVYFYLADIVDYADVDAIIFCGHEIPITEKSFAIPEITME